jgi:hypothetical protein
VSAGVDAVHALRVPLELDVDVGEPLFVERSVAIERDAWVRAAVGGIRVRQAAPSEAELVATLDCELFGGGDPSPSRAWVGEVLAAAGAVEVPGFQVRVVRW